MSQSAKDFFTGMGLGVFAICLVISVVPGSAHKMAKDALEECERTLPRNQKCTVIAIPKTEEK